MTKGVFFFSFSMEYHEGKDEIINYGFTFDFGKQIPFPFDEAVMDEQDELESEYGVHDWFNMPDDRVIGVGYGSYEVERHRIKDLMEEWRGAFEIICDEVGEAVQFESDFNCSDYDIYELIEEKYEQDLVSE